MDGDTRQLHEIEAAQRRVDMLLVECRLIGEYGGTVTPAMIATAQQAWLAAWEHGEADPIAAAMASVEAPDGQ